MVPSQARRFEIARGEFRQAAHQVGTLARLTRDLPRFLRNPVTPQQAARRVQEQLRFREQRFLTLVERGIFASPRSPYLWLLRQAGCERGDLRKLVSELGLEGALAQLSAAGVYVRFDEISGRSRMVRGSQSITWAERDFDNRLTPQHYEMATGGSSGKTSSVRGSLNWIAERALSDAVAFEAHGLSKARHVVWRTAPLFPLVYARTGSSPIAWFIPLEHVPARVKIGGFYLSLLARLSGSRLPRPRYFDLQDAEGMASLLARIAREGSTVVLTSRASTAVRVAHAAQRQGRSLDGVRMILSGEPTTAAKCRMIEEAGAGVLVRYSLSEAGTIGYGCAARAAPDDLHFVAHSHALTTRSTPGAPGRTDSEALLVTNLTLVGAKILVNFETGDEARVERRDCGCLLGRLGLDRHLSEVRSYEKLTGEGVTFVRTDLLRVLDEALPADFGGSGADYQVIEDEDANAVTRLYLRASPRLGPLDEAALRGVFLKELGRDGTLQQYMSTVWQLTETIQVTRDEPIVTPGGKVLPFQLLKRRGRTPTAPAVS